MPLSNENNAVPPTPARRPTHVYVGAGADTDPFGAEWCNGTTIHCIDPQPHSQYGLREYYPSGGSSKWSSHWLGVEEDGEDGVPDGTTLNRFARPDFTMDIIYNYSKKGFLCSMEDYELMNDTLLLGPTYTRLGGGPTRIRFINEERDIIIWYHFNACLPDDAVETLKFIGTYDGIICNGHWPNKTLIHNADIPDNSLTFRAYAGTCYGIYASYNITEDDFSNSMVIRLSFCPIIRSKFKNFVFYDTLGTEHRFDIWEEFLVFYHYNDDLTFDPEEETDDSDEER